MVPGIARGFQAPFVQQPFPALFLPPPVQAGVHRNAIEPGGKLGRTLKGIQLLIRPHKRLLRQVLTIGQRPGHAKGQRMDHLLILADQFGKGCMIAVPALCNQIFSSSVSPMRCNLTNRTPANERTFDFFLRGHPGRPDFDGCGIACRSGRRYRNHTASRQTGLPERSFRAKPGVCRHLKT